MHRRRTAIPFAALALCVQPVLAQVIQPGLWEATSKIGAGNPNMQLAVDMMQKQLANLPPEQRQAMEAMMAKQGVSIGSGGVVAKMCITPEMAAQRQLPIQQQGNCTWQHAPLVGSSLKFSFSCTNPQANGDGSVTFSGPTAYTSSMRVTSNATGSPETVDIASSGRWLGANCGGVKPIALPPGK